jgi:peptide chain release factor 1
LGIPAVIVSIWHILNLTFYKLYEVIEGGLEQVVEPLVNKYKADQFAALGE